MEITSSYQNQGKVLVVDVGTKFDFSKVEDFRNAYGELGADVSHITVDLSRTESGKIQPEPKEQARSVSSDGVVRIHRETKGRKGKGVSLIKGLDLAADELKKLGSELKKKCGCGGAVKDGVIEVQTDDREKLRTLLTDKGYKVKLAGG